MSKQQRQRNNTNAPKRSLTPAQKQEVSILARRQINKASELKFTVFGSAVTTGTSWVFSSLTDVPQGVLDSNRVGDGLTPVSLRLKYQWDTNALKAVPTEFFRVIVFQWFPNSVNLAPSGALMFLDDPQATAINWRSNYSVDYLAKGSAQFRVLYDKLHTLVGYGNNLTWNPSMSGLVSTNINLASARKNIQFTAASTTSGAGKIYVGTIGSAAANSVVVTYNSIFMFKDV